MKPCRFSRMVWITWGLFTGLTFAYAETRGYKRKCHPTLSRDLAWLTGCHPDHPKPWGRVAPWVFVPLGAALSYHLLTLKSSGVTRGPA